MSGVKYFLLKFNGRVRNGPAIFMVNKSQKVSLVFTHFHSCYFKQTKNPETNTLKWLPF